MSVHPVGYLRLIARQSLLPESERDRIGRSVLHMRRLINRSFGKDILEHKLFGSYVRRTILPRDMDAQSDVDNMVVFRDDSFRPQTYLDRLRRFVENNYSRSQIQQSHPTIQLELNHIRFELVPATHSSVYGYQIPARVGEDSWMYTEPERFRQELTRANDANEHLIKPLIRIVKYWNANMGYPFESYDLEQRVVQYHFGSTNRNIYTFFCNFMGDLDAGWHAPQWKREKLERAHRVMDEMQNLVQLKKYDIAVENLKKILPAVNRSVRQIAWI